jgi:hypothetical protein
VKFLNSESDVVVEEDDDDFKAALTISVNEG